MADIAHIAGLVCAGLHPSPVSVSDFVTTSTHKTLRGPRGGLIMCKAEYARSIDRSVFPGIQGGPLMHAIAAKAAGFGEALKPGFTFAVKKVLRLGIIMLGIRLTIFDVFKLGAFGVPIVVFCILGALFFTTRINRWVRLPERLGTLIAVGTSIGGVGVHEGRKQPKDGDHRHRIGYFLFLGVNGRTGGHDG